MNRGAYVFQQSTSQLKILDVRRMTRSRFHTKDPQAPGICAPLILKLVLTSYHNHVLLKYLLLLDTFTALFASLSLFLSNIQIFCHASHNIVYITADPVYLPETLIFLTVLFELFAIWTLTAMFSPWWYNCHTTNSKIIIIF